MLCAVLPGKVDTPSYLRVPPWVPADGGALGGGAAGGANGCSTAPPPHLIEVGTGEDLPEPMNDKPRILLRAPCLLVSFEQVARKYKPTGSWFYIKDPSGVSVEITHKDEAPIPMLSGLRDNTTIVDFLQDNILPHFGRMTDTTYDWYIFQDQGLAFVLLETPEEVAEARPAMTEVAIRFKGRYMITHVDVDDNREWLASEFGITTFPAIVVQREAVSGQRFTYRGALSAAGVAQFIHDVDDGCLGYDIRRRTFWGRGPPWREVCRWSPAGGGLGLGAPAAPAAEDAADRADTQESDVADP